MAKRKSGSGGLRHRQDGRWEGRILTGYDEDGKPITKSVLGKTRKECTEKMDALREKLEQEHQIKPKKLSGDMTLAQWIDYWYQGSVKQTIKASSQMDYENCIYKHIIPRLGSFRLKDIKQTDVQHFLTEEKNSGRLVRTDVYGKGLSNAAVRATYFILRNALLAAMNEKLIHSNPAQGCELPQKRAREMQVLEHDELQRFLIQARHDECYELVLLELATGMRRGEICALQWDDINFRTGELKICRQVGRVKGELTVTTPKTKGSVRSVILPPAVLKVLEELKERTPSRWLFPSPVKEDSPKDPHAMYKLIHRVLARAGCKEVRFHDLRHTFATTALEHGMDVKTLSTVLGHVTAATTIDVYSHVTDNMLMQAAGRIESGIGRGEAAAEHALPDLIQEANKKIRPRQNFQAKDGDHRRNGSGGVHKVKDDLWEGSYSPRFPDGKRWKMNVYAESKEECEKQVEQLIKNVRNAITSGEDTMEILKTFAPKAYRKELKRQGLPVLMEPRLDHGRRWLGSYSLVLSDGKRYEFSVTGKTEQKCQERLDKLVRDIERDITADEDAEEMCLDYEAKGIIIATED